MMRLSRVLLPILAAILTGTTRVSSGEVVLPPANLAASDSTPAPTVAPCSPLLFDQRQYRLQTTESYIGVLTVLIPAANSGVVGYNVRTPGHESSLILNNVTGILQKARKMSHQTVELLVQGETKNSEKKAATNITDVVDVDETLVIIDIIDENDSPPVLDCSMYGDTCDNLVVGFPVSQPATAPAPLLRLSSTDADTGSYGTDGIQYSVNSTSFSVDQSGLLWLIDPTVSDKEVIITTAKDNFGQKPYMQAQAFVTAVPITDRQLFFVSTDRQLTDSNDVTALLEAVRVAGRFGAVFSPQLQAINYGTQVSGVSTSLENGTSHLFVYAISRDNDGEYQAVEKDEFQRALKNMSEPNSMQYVESKHDQMNRDAGHQGSETGLIAALAVVSCLLVAAIAGAAFREYRARQRHDST